MWDLREAAEILEAELLRAKAPYQVRGACADSRRIQPGELFVALSGQKHDGHDFLGQAFARGAVGALVSRDPGVGHNLLLVPDVKKALWELARWRREALEFIAVGVTGSFGKTTAKELLAAALSTAYAVYRAPESYNTEIGVPLSILSVPANTEVAVFELAESDPVELRKLCELLQPWAGMITAVGPAHLALLGTVEKAAEAVWILAEFLPEEGVLALAWDFPELRARVERCDGFCLRFGHTQEADFFPREIADDDPQGIRFVAETPAGSVPVKLRLLGAHRAVLACGALALAWGLGIPGKVAAQAMAEVPPLPHRLELRPAPFGWILDDCFNANPVSMQAALRTLVRLRLPVRVRAALLGDMLELGPEEALFHRAVAEAARRLGVDLLFAFGPRMSAAFSAFGGPGFAEPEDLDKLVSAVREALGSGPALLLVKGSRGLFLERVVEGLSHGQEQASPEKT
ncbi:MAG: UDP-N-acetylmuramoyl-tripeptide--D-alanyl-D-alanine ligase [Candidatus Bipolaricaulota bacterium]|nr:UDP-N-acetylmuramoyl-tripeptide--D-alanyl-D-alanine ligase [Candidatus Bipolaricaulota bacterium]MDW8126327.1 UDP-N-acetylmuramoyl-tripeptide--D-alanyl-D-alanine ligase [Candidatus Bipolaricaulota bacterium]